MYADIVQVCRGWWLFPYSYFGVQGVPCHLIFKNNYYSWDFDFTNYSVFMWRFGKFTCMLLLLLLFSQNSQIPFKTGSFTMVLHLCSQESIDRKEKWTKHRVLCVYVCVCACACVCTCGFIWGSGMRAFLYMYVGIS